MSSTPETTTPPQSRELEANQTPDLQPQDIHPRSLRELVDYVSGKHLRGTYIEGESGVADLPMFPFLALVGQREMKLALLLSLINPALGGVLLMGPRGTGKTTAARSLSDLLPDVPRSLCHYGCLPEDIETGANFAIHSCKLATTGEHQCDCVLRDGRVAVAFERVNGNTKCL